MAYGNILSHVAADLTAVSHTRAGPLRWLIIGALSLLWIVGGMVVWTGRGSSPVDALYLTISAVAMWEDYLNAKDDVLLQLVRFAAVATPVVSVLFAFSGQLGQALARVFNLGAGNHVVITGAGNAALALALDCRKAGDAVIVVARDLPDETALGLRRKGVVLLEGEAAHVDTLATARVDHAAHVVAFAPSDADNIQIEAAVRRLARRRKRRRPIAMHTATRSPMLLKEAREMRSREQRSKAAPAPVDPKPFSLEELAARGLLQAEAQTLLSLAQQLGQDRVHIVCFGFDAVAEAFAERVFMSLWSAHFAPPRVTVMCPDPQRAEAGFRARHREAFAYPGAWSADIAFLGFDWDAASVDVELLNFIENAAIDGEGPRGKPTAILVATGGDPGNIHLAIVLKRACNQNLRWPVPIFMAETSQSEFSLHYARGDETEVIDAYLQAFGANQVTARRAQVINGALDRGAAIAHEYYEYSQRKPEHGHMSMKELQSATRDWASVLETFRAANRAVADSALVKLWDAGWRPAGPGEKGDTAPAVPDGDLSERLARCEHDRWMAERLMAGWRPVAPGEQRNNDLMAHDKVVPWEQLGEADRNNDFVQVRAAFDIARLMKPRGFVRRQG